METSDPEKQRKILVVDDDEEMRSMLCDFIAEEGYAPSAVESGSEAFRKLAGESFDLIITDIRMPGPNGLDILPGLKRTHPQVAILAITAFGSEGVKQKALERGAAAYVEKPISLHELRGLLRKFFAPRRQKP